MRDTRVWKTMRRLPLVLVPAALIILLPPAAAVDPGSLDGLNGWIKGAAILGVLGTDGVAVGFLMLIVTEVGRYKLLRALAGIPLFSRFDKDEVLEHTTREQLYQYIRNNP